MYWVLFLEEFRGSTGAGGEESDNLIFPIAIAALIVVDELLRVHAVGKRSRTWRKEIFLLMDGKLQFLAFERVIVR